MKFLWVTILHGGRISHFSIDFCMGLTTVRRYCAAHDTFTLTYYLAFRCGYLFTTVVVATDMYNEVPDAVPPIHAVSSHVATDKDPSK